MKLTPEILKALGFKKQQCRGGYDRWYHQSYINKTINSKLSLSNDGELSFTDGDEKAPQTLEELSKLMLDTFRENGKEEGKSELRSAFNTLLNPDY